MDFRTELCHGLCELLTSKAYGFIEMQSNLTRQGQDVVSAHEKIGVTHNEH